jgi:hypothetical protein
VVVPDDEMMRPTGLYSSDPPRDLGRSRRFPDETVPLAGWPVSPDEDRAPHKAIEERGPSLVSNRGYICYFHRDKAPSITSEGWRGDD